MSYLGVQCGLNYHRHCVLNRNVNWFQTKASHALAYLLLNTPPHALPHALRHARAVTRPEIWLGSVHTSYAAIQDAAFAHPLVIIPPFNRPNMFAPVSNKCDILTPPSHHNPSLIHPHHLGGSCAWCVPPGFTSVSTHPCKRTPSDNSFKPQNVSTGVCVQACCTSPCTRLVRTLVVYVRPGTAVVILVVRALSIEAQPVSLFSSTVTFEILLSPLIFAGLSNASPGCCPGDRTRVPG